MALDAGGRLVSGALAGRNAAASDATAPRRTALSEEDIRRSLARELHDRVAQTLTSMLVDLENFKADQFGRDSVVRQADLLQESTREVLNNLRDVIYELRGYPIVDEGFVDTVRAILGRYQEKGHIGVDLSVAPGWPAQIQSPAALNLYRIIEEALVNVRRHSTADRVLIRLSASPYGELLISISDNGRGMEVVDLGPTSLGMVGMSERALVLGGRFQVERPSGGGTTVIVTVPTHRS